MARVEVGLQDANNDDFGGNTERLKELGFGQGSDRLSDGTDNGNQEKTLSVYDMLNVKYLNRISVEVFTQEYIIQNRLQKIQKFYKLRHAKRVQAAKLICLRAKIFLNFRG